MLFRSRAFVEIEVDGKMVQSERSSGERYRVPPLTRHRLEAIEDTLIFEVSTPELEDVVRLADDYGRTSTND